VTRIKAYLAREPVRIDLYGVVAAVCAGLVTFGVIGATIVPCLLAVAAALLVLPSPVEQLRAQVTPDIRPAVVAVVEKAVEAVHAVLPAVEIPQAVETEIEAVVEPLVEHAEPPTPPPV